MKVTVLKFAAAGACLLCLLFSAPAQKRKNNAKRAKRTVAVKIAAKKKAVTKRAAKKPVAADSVTNTAEIKTGATKVSTQIKNVSKFIYKLGGIARVVEDLDKEIAARRASSNAPQLNAKIKRDVLTSIRNLRAGLAALEIEFRTKPALKNYLFQIQGISDMTGVAEDQAADGQLTESGRTLLAVVEKLSDTLAALP